MGRLLSFTLVLFLCVFALVALADDESKPELRTWTSSNGKYTIKAQLSETSQTAVRLRTDEGKLIEVPLDKLSEADQNFVLEYNKAKATEIAVAVREVHTLEGHHNILYGLDISPDGKLLVTAGHDRLLRVWDVESGKELRQLRGHLAGVGCVAFSPDSKFVASGSWDKTLRLWDVESGEQLKELHGHRFPILTVAYSPDGKRVLTGSDDFRLWELEEDGWLHEFEGHEKTVWSLAFSPDGKLCLSGSHDETMRLWEVETAKELNQFKGHKDRVRCVRFSPDGKLALSSAVGGNEVRLWDLESGEQIRQFDGHENGVMCVAFSPDGRLAASGSGRLYWNGAYDATIKDRSVRIWNVATGEQLAKIDGHKSFISGVVFSKDGKYLATSSGDATAKIWELTY